MRVALYARVSTLNGQNPETQLIELREYASRRGWEVIGEYVDAGVSGSKDSRPSLNRMMSPCPPAEVRRHLCVEARPLRQVAQAPRHGHSRA